MLFFCGLGGNNIKGLIVIAFFSIFATASILIPIPLFPGSWLSSLIGNEISIFSILLSALFNGFAYGSILGIIFYAISNRLER